MNQLLTFYRLKELKRAGWLRVGIAQPESVASHSWGMGLLAILYCPKHLDLTKVLKLALVHDLPEVVCGDITPHDGVSSTQKESMEKQAAQEILGDELFSLWREYQENKTAESQYVHRLDKLDMAIQAKAYEHLADTQEFIDSALEKMHQEERDTFETIKK